MIRWLIFVIGSGWLLYISRSSLRVPHSHGFYRFLAWEFMLILIIVNIDHWLDYPFNLLQIISWLLLIISVFLVLDAVYLLKKAGQPGMQHDNPTLIGFEKTTTLVTTGIYKFLRHPMYASLLYLALGIYLKDISVLSTILVFISTLLLILTARMEEKENLLFFGESYQDYMRRTKMFLPFVF